MKDQKKHCSCKRKGCPRHGNCEACLAYHKTNRRYPRPQCGRRPEQEDPKPERTD